MNTEAWFRLPRQISDKYSILVLDEITSWERFQDMITIHFKNDNSNRWILRNEIWHKTVVSAETTPCPGMNVCPGGCDSD